MLTRLNTDAVRSPRSLEQLERDVMKRIREECPDVKWLSSYAVLGPCDYLDVFIANDIETAAKISALIRTFGHAQTEIWTATEWDRLGNRPYTSWAGSSDRRIDARESRSTSAVLTFLGTRGGIKGPVSPALAS
jgi:hypothetical protein